MFPEEKSAKSVWMLLKRDFCAAIPFLFHLVSLFHLRNCSSTKCPQISQPIEAYRSGVIFDFFQSSLKNSPCFDKVTLPPIVMEVKNGCISDRIASFSNIAIFIHFPLPWLWEKGYTQSSCRPGTSKPVSPLCQGWMCITLLGIHVSGSGAVGELGMAKHYPPWN